MCVRCLSLKMWHVGSWPTLNAAPSCLQHGQGRSGKTTFLPRSKAFQKVKPLPSCIMELVRHTVSTLKKHDSIETA